MDTGTTAVLERETSIVAGRKQRDLVELCVGYALILVVIWTPRPWQRIVYFVAAAFILSVLSISFAGWKAMGLRLDNLARSIWLVGVALLTSAVAIFAASRMHTLRSPIDPTLLLQRYSGYIVFAFIQQVLLQDFFLLRLLRLVCSPRYAAIAAATIFALAHLPNPILTLITFAWGLAACFFFLRYRNLYPLALAHAIMGITIAITVPGPVIRNMRVGIGYLAYTSRHMDRRVR